MRERVPRLTKRDQPDERENIRRPHRPHGLCDQDGQPVVELADGTRAVYQVADLGGGEEARHVLCRRRLRSRVLGPVLGTALAALDGPFCHRFLLGMQVSPTKGKLLTAWHIVTRTSDRLERGSYAPTPTRREELPPGPPAGARTTRRFQSSPRPARRRRRRGPW